MPMQNTKPSKCQPARLINKRVYHSLCLALTSSYLILHSLKGP